MADSDGAGVDWYSNERATFGDRIAWAREAAGLTRSEMARRLGVQPKTVRHWEDDVSEPRANKLQMLSGVLAVSMGWLLTGEGEGPPALEGVEASGDIEGILDEMRDARRDALRLSERVGRLEKRLRRSVGR